MQVRLMKLLFIKSNIMNYRFCSKCKTGLRRSYSSGVLANWCRDCQVLASKASYQKHKDKNIRRARRWKIKNRDKYLEVLRRAVNRRRMGALFFYSKGKLECACCGENHVEFLVIDHINGGGIKHRKSISPKSQGGQKIYSWLKQNNYPNGFRVLCQNCNSSLGHYHYCPHKKFKHEKD